MSGDRTIRFVKKRANTDRQTERQKRQRARRAEQSSGAHRAFASYQRSIAMSRVCYLLSVLCVVLFFCRDVTAFGYPRLRFDVTLPAGAALSALVPPTQPASEAPEEVTSSLQILSVNSATRTTTLTAELNPTSFSGPAFVSAENATESGFWVDSAAGAAGWTGPVVAAYPDITGCSPLGPTTANGDSWVGKIVMVQRGTCTFQLKAQAVQDAGGRAALIFYCSYLAPALCPTTFQGFISVAAVAVNTVIPSWLMRWWDGQVCDARSSRARCSAQCASSAHALCAICDRR
jgi:hypothetical protein